MSKPNIHVYYSKTEDNRFLKPAYIQTLKANLSPQMAKRMLDGRWISIGKEGVYYAYNPKVNYRKDQEYVVDLKHPIRITHDFNIGEGKPMSATLFQYVDKTFHFFDEVIVEGIRTEEVYEELEGREVFECPVKFIIHGDASGKHKDTRSKHSDYDIIREFLVRYRRKDGSRLDFEIIVPKANPPIRKRHNTVNAQMKNALNEVHFYVYGRCKVLHEGCKLTKLKPGADYIEDDSKAYQHVTTAAGYGIMSTLTAQDTKPQGTVEL